MTGPIDTTEIGILTSIFVDIVGEKIPAFRQRYGVGSQVEWNVINMLGAALDCTERCAVLAAADPAVSAAFERRAAVVRELIENAQVERNTWLEVEGWAIVAEAEGQTKH